MAAVMLAWVRLFLHRGSSINNFFQINAISGKLDSFGSYEALRDTIAFQSVLHNLCVH